MKDPIETEDEIHVVPESDIITHELNEMCVCAPKWDRENKKEFLIVRAKKKVFVHNSMKDRIH